jgi:PAS domain S-box-containing protein
LTELKPDIDSARGTALGGVPGGLRKRRSVNFWLRWLVIVCIVPAWGATAYFLIDSYQQGLDTRKSDMIATARALVQTVDAELARSTSAMQVLATSPSLTSGHLADFYAQAQQVLPAASAVNIALADRTAQQIVNTLRPFGAPLPLNGKPDVVRYIFETGKPVILDMFSGPVTGQYIMAVQVPVIRDGRVIYALAAGFRSERFATILRQQQAPADWVISIFDSTGTIVSRTHSPEQFIGQKGAPALVRRMGEIAEDVIEVPTLEGIPVLAAFKRSSSSGWSVAIGIPSASLAADLQRSLWLSIITAGTLLIGGLFLAGSIKNSIAQSIRGLSQSAMALASGRQPLVPTIYISEVAEVAKALGVASQQIAQRAADQRKTAVAEGVAARFSALLEAAPDAIILARRDGTISFANGRAETIFGYPKSELIGQPVELLIPRRHRDDHHAHVASFFSTPQLREMGAGLPLFARRKNDTEFPVEVSLSPIDIDGEQCAIAAIRDVTERKSLEATVDASRVQLVDSARLSALGAMAGGIAHEINNPLAVVDALVQDLGEAAEERVIAPDEIVRTTGKIAQYVDRIGKIVKSMRHIARDGTKDPFEDVPVCNIVEQVLSICEQRFSGHSVALLNSPIDPALRVACREVQVSQVLLNLLQNAFDAVQERSGDKWVRVEVAASDERVRLSVVDCGSGLSADLKTRIMEPFFTTKPVGQGTGLGLSLSKQIAEEHGGTLEVDEDRGHTRFSLNLPRSK